MKKQNQSKLHSPSKSASSKVRTSISKINSKLFLSTQKKNSQQPTEIDNTSDTNNISTSNPPLMNGDCPSILIDQELYDAKRIKDLIQTNNVLNLENDALKKKVSEKEFQVRHLTGEVNDLRQNYDKVKSVLNQKMNINEADKENSFVGSKLTERLKKQGVSGESFSPSSVDMKVYEKSDSSMRVIENAIKSCQNDFLKKLEPTQIKQVSQCMYEKAVKANVYIIKEGEVGEHMYVLASGKMEVLKDNKKLRDMYPGELFGELAVLQNCLRTASVRATCESSFWTIDRKIYQTILQKSNLQQSEEHKKFLESVNLLKNLSKEELVKIVDALTSEQYEKGEYIVREGEDGQTFYIIKHGEVKVEKTIEGSNEPQEIRRLKVGDYFGERALLKNEIRTASVIADSELVEVLALERDDFIRLIGKNDELNTKDYGDEKRRIPICPIETVTLSARKTETVKDPYHHILLNDLEIITILGVGGFGKVELVRHKKDKNLVFALKSLYKKFIVERKQENHILSERNILLEVKSPFICQLYRTFRDTKYVYMLLEACLGGEVWTVLRNKTFFDDKTSRFIMGCVILAIEYLHSKGIIYRDLKPENLVMDRNGYAKLCDFGFAKKIGVGRKTFTFCGTPEYVAPEVILNKGHDTAADLWSLGILLLELQTGSPPFHGDEPMKIYNQILKGIDKIEFSSKFTKISEQFIKMLCRDNPTERLGYGKTGIAAIMKHKYFAGFNWHALAKREMTPFIVPKLESNIDTKYFDQFQKVNCETLEETSGWDIGFEN